MFRNKSIERLRRMLHAIRSRDFTLHYATENLRGEERLLAQEINAVISEFRDTQARQEAQYAQYETLLNQVNAALIVADEDGRVKWMNQRAIHHLCGFRIQNLDMLASVNKTLPIVMNQLKAGQQRLLHLRIADRDVQWSIHMTQYFSLGQQLRLFSIENMLGVLQQNEVQAQRRLVSVLTHEIMNSLAPIISLSETLLDNTPPPPLLNDALAAIHRRSEGLLRFVHNYRTLSRIPPPQKAPVVVGHLIADIQRLFPSPHITFNIEDAAEVIDIDRNQIEQMLINLLKNAEEASPSPQITLTTRTDRAARRFIITVEDNGVGILPEALDRIFVPFFTTKQGGSGIGLSISRQIVVQHGGTIRVSCQPGHTIFTVEI